MSEIFRQDDWMRFAISAALGLFAFVALFPFMGQDSDPPKFFSVFGYEVQRGDLWLALPAAFVVAFSAWWLLRQRGTGS
jgi:hypothetical protein